MNNEKTIISEKIAGTAHGRFREEPKITNGSSFLGHIRASILAMIALLILCCGVYPLLVWGIGQALFHHQANGSLVDKNGAFTSDAAQVVGSALIGQNFSAKGYFHPRPSAAGNGYDATASGGSNLGPLSDKLINGATNPATTQPTTQPESLAFDGVRLRTVHYAVDNRLLFKLYSQRADGTGPRTEVPLKSFEDKDGNLLDVNLVDAFPHPPTDTADRVILMAGDFTTPDGKPVLIPGDAVTASGSGLDPHISPANAEMQKFRVATERRVTPQQIQALIDAHTDGPDLGVLGDAGVNVLMLNLDLDAKYPIRTGR